MTPPPQIAIIADDLTGAADVGAGLAGKGLVALVSLGPGSVPAADVLVVSTESRHIPEQDAVARVGIGARHLLQQTSEGETRWFYKKIDSTLRGHPGPELAVMMRELGLEQAVVAPAFPAQGRTTIDGQQRVDGAPVERTHFRDEVECSNLLSVFDVGHLPVRHIDLTKVRDGAGAVHNELTAAGQALFIADAETEDDLTTICQAADNASIRLLCGSAGLMAALAGTVKWRPQAPTPELPTTPDGPVLTIAGSRQPCTARQVVVAEQEGAVVVKPGATFFDNNEPDIDSLAELICRELGRNRDVIVTTAGLDNDSLQPTEVAARLAQVAKIVLDECPVGSLALTGGDIAAAAFKALGVSTMWLHGEVMPGIPYGRLLGGLFAGLPVVTKAGGFGDDNALHAAILHHKT